MPTAARSAWIAVPMMTGESMPEPLLGHIKGDVDAVGIAGLREQGLCLFRIVGIGREGLVVRPVEGRRRRSGRDRGGTPQHLLDQRRLVDCVVRRLADALVCRRVCPWC